MVVYFPATAMKRILDKLELVLLLFLIGQVSFQIDNKTRNPNPRANHIHNKPKAGSINGLIDNISNDSNDPNNSTCSIQYQGESTWFFHTITRLCHIQVYLTGAGAPKAPSDEGGFGAVQPLGLFKYI